MRRRVRPSPRHAVRHESHLDPALGAFRFQRIHRSLRLTHRAVSPTSPASSAAASAFSIRVAADVLVPERRPPPLRPLALRPHLLQESIIPHDVRVSELANVHERRAIPLPIARVRRFVPSHALQSARPSRASRARVLARTPPARRARVVAARAVAPGRHDARRGAKCRHSRARRRSFRFVRRVRLARLARAR